MSCFITTNLIPVTEKRAIQMTEMGIDRIYVSLWAATNETYLKTHPNANEDSFQNIDKRLRQFKELKQQNGCPKIIIHNVIFNMNCHEFTKMIEYAIDVGAAAVQFTMVYTIPDATDALLLDDSERENVITQIDNLPEEIWKKEGLHGQGTFLYEIDIFRNRLVEPSAQVGNYDKTLMDKLPCQLGWFYTIIRPNGDVIPCCKGMNKPMGNIYKNSFEEIWYSDVYNEFREKGKKLFKSNPYFAPIGCYKMCDNVGLLNKIENQMEKLRSYEGVTRMLAVPIIKKFI
jgi:MoaA/NifB/PqqE/SkfB family radical SAM enzyme